MAGLDDPVIPPEIWREILARMPVKSILRYRSVCKSWYSLVSCPSFISHHSITNLHNNNGNRLLLHLQDVETGACPFSSHDMESGEHDDDYSHGRFNRPSLVIVGSCNGLICLSDDGYDDLSTVTMTFLIWNPAIRKIVQLPSLSFCSKTQYPSLVGFGFDSNTSDYKVMCNLYSNASLDEVIQKNVCWIFDLSKGIWRSSSPLGPSQIAWCGEAECYVNGALHWSIISDRILLSFDMSDECFREIRMPDLAEYIRNGDDDRIVNKSVTFGGLLHLIVWKTRPDDYVDEWESCSVWAMKEYGVAESWIKVSNIDLRRARVLPRTNLFPKTFILWAKHEILMVHYPHFVYDKQDLVLYNTESRESKRFISTTKYVQNLCLYKENLALM